MQSADPHFPEDCAEARRSVSLRLDAELNPPQDAFLEVHLAGCDACRRHAEELTALTWELRGAALVNPEIGPFLAARRFAYRRPSAVSAAAATAAAAAVAVVALSLGTASLPNTRRGPISDRLIFHQLTLKERQMQKLAPVVGPASARPPNAPSGLDENA